MVRLPVYLDYNATTPCDPAVVEAMLPYFSQKPGNAASHTHAYGWEAREAVELAREQVASLLHCEAGEIIFTSGATESINLALKGVFELYARKGNHVITSNAEHKAVLDCCAELERRGAEVTYLPVNSQGLIDPQQLEAALRPHTILVSILYANNETGVIQPIRQLAGLTRQKGILFMTDATQAMGKIPLDVQEEEIDLLAFSAHKLYGPKGSGGLYLRRKSPRVRLYPQMHGGGHEKGFRSGTLNVPGIVGLGAACVQCMEQMEADSRRLRQWRDAMEKKLMASGNVQRNGHPDKRLPHVSNLAFRQVSGTALMSALSSDLAVSSGSACTSARPEPSHVLMAMGLDEELARASLRISLGRMTTQEEVEYATEKIIRTLPALQRTHITET